MKHQETDDGLLISDIDWCYKSLSFWTDDELAALNAILSVIRHEGDGDSPIKPYTTAWVDSLSEPHAALKYYTERWYICAYIAKVLQLCLDRRLRR